MSAGPPRAASVVLVALLAIDGLLAWLAIQAALVFVELVWLAARGRHVFQPIIETHAGQYGTLRGVQLAAWAATAAALLGWVLGVRSGLAACGIPLRYARRDVLLAFLIPGVNLVRPARILAETIAAGRDARMPPLLAWWWGLTLAALATDLAARAMAARGAGLLDLGRGMQLTILASLGQLAGAALGIAVVVAVNRRARAVTLS